jgi:Zn-dependent protease
LEIEGIIRQVAVSAVPILLAVTLHEVAHGYAAYRLGDATAKMTGRLTLNPLAHVDPVGTVLMPAMLFVLSQGQFVFGYAKPVPINPYNFRNPKKGMAISAAAGPGMNVALSVASLILLKIVFLLSGILPEAVFTPLQLMLKSSIYINVFLAALNLMPVLPLDGGRILAGFLPPRQSHAFSRLEPYGMIIVLLLFITGLYRVFVIPVVNLLLYFLNLISQLL